MVILHSSGKNTNIIISWLRHDFAIISQLFYENHIVLNQHKSQFPTLDFNEPSPDFSFNNTLIENVIEKCILALVIDNKLNFKSQLTLFWRRSLSYRNHPLICCANQWTGFYVIGVSVMKELKNILYKNTNQKPRHS